MICFLSLWRANKTPGIWLLTRVGQPFKRIILTFKSNACIVWRRFANLFETSQSLFWASFGLVSLTDFELTGIKEFTRFWALLMFGSYSVCNIIVLLNMLIAMMSNSFQVRF